MTLASYPISNPSHAPSPIQAISIIECDLNVDFAPPVGYVPPERQPAPEEVMEEAPMIVDEDAFTAFKGRERNTGPSRNCQSNVLTVQSPNLTPFQFPLLL